MSPIIYSEVGKYIQSEKQNKYNSIINLIDNISLFASPIVGSLILTASSNNIILLLFIIMVSFIASLYFVDRTQFHQNVNHNIEKSSLINDIRYFINNKSILLIIIHFMIFNLILFPLLSINFPSYITEDLNEGSFSLALLEIFFSFGLIMMSFYQTSIKSSINIMKFNMLFSFVLSSIGLFIISLSFNIYIACIGSFIIGTSLSLLRISNTSYFQLSLNKDMYTQFFALRGSLLFSIAPISTILSTFLLNYLSSSKIMFYNGIFLLILLLSFYMNIRYISKKSILIIKNK